MKTTEAAPAAAPVGRTAVLPIRFDEWQMLRTLVRSDRPLAGHELRIWPSRYTKSGEFLNALVALGVIECVGTEEPSAKTRRKPAIFRNLYRLTEKGKHAAEYGECEQPYDRSKPAS